MQKKSTNSVKSKLGLVIISLCLSVLSCQLISPTPASWSGTPTAKIIAATNTAFARTQQAAVADDVVVTPTATSTQAIIPTPQPTVNIDGPWLVYPAPGGDALHAYDVEAEQILEITLPEPIYTADLQTGLSPSGRRLMIRAGSPLNTDELALYEINLPSTEVTKRTPLLSLNIQRRIVNQIGTRALQTFEVVTRPDSIAWSPDGRFLAFTAALDNDSSDLYVYDTLNDRIERLNGVFSQNASPFWSPSSNWLVSQELGFLNESESWRSEIVSGLRVPGYDDQNTLYTPPPGSADEVFVGWINASNFISYSLTAEGPRLLRQVNVDEPAEKFIFEGSFNGVDFDPSTGALAFYINGENATSAGFIGGVYFLQLDSPDFTLLRAGDWDRLYWDKGGLFVAAGTQGVFVFTSAGEGYFLPDEGDVRISPDGNWMIAWGDGINSSSGARLYQPPSPYPLQTLSEDLVEVVMWQPNSKAFFIHANGILYQLTFPGLNLQQVKAGFPQEAQFNLVWVEQAND